MLTRITKNIVAILLLATITLSATKYAHAQGDCPEVTFYISTGIDNNNSLLPFTSPDPNWIAPAGMGNVTSPHPLWVTLTGSRWLGDANYAPSATTFTYYRYFYVPPTATSATITFQSLVDNNLDIYIDGTAVGSPAGFMLPDIFSYTGPLTPTLSGWHMIQADVYNVSGPAGLDLQGYVTYQPINVTHDISTGVIGGLLPSGSGLLAFGVTDPNWSSSPVGYTVTEPNAWSWDGFAGSIWLGVGDNTASSPLTFYTYSRSFTIPSSGGTLTFESMADDEALYYLDGSSTPIASTVGAYGGGWGFKLYNKASYTGFIPCGPHTLTAVVKNNQTVVGFNLHGSISYCDNGIECDEGTGLKSQPTGTSILTTTPTELAIFPNPAKNEIRFTRSLNECKLQVVGLDGKSVLEIIQFKGDKLDISEIAAGSYILRIIQDADVRNYSFRKTE